MNIKIEATALILAFFCEFTPVEVKAAEREPEFRAQAAHRSSGARPLRAYIASSTTKRMARGSRLGSPGDGQDTVSATQGADNTLSLGGGIISVPSTASLSSMERAAFTSRIVLGA